MSIARPSFVRAALLVLVAVPSLASAQWRRDRDRDRDRDRGRDRDRVRAVRISIERERVPDRSVTMMVGALASDDDGRNFPMASLRADWRLRRWLSTELGVSYAIGDIDRPAGAQPGSGDVTTQVGSATLGLRAELPTAWLRPYVGAAAGLAGRHEDGGDRYIRPTMAFPGGVRLLIGDRVSLRGEARFRFDQRQRGGQAVYVEQVGGLSVAF